MLIEVMCVQVYISRKFKDDNHVTVVKVEVIGNTSY